VNTLPPNHSLQADVPDGPRPELKRWGHTFFAFRSKSELSVASVRVRKRNARAMKLTVQKSSFMPSPFFLSKGARLQFKPRAAKFGSSLGA
jgi:hypothetical protein